MVVDRGQLGVEIVNRLIEFNLTVGGEIASEAGREPANMITGTLQIESVRDSQSEGLRGLYWNHGSFSSR
jgi:hypothetical protein